MMINVTVSHVLFLISTRQETGQCYSLKTSLSHGYTENAIPAPPGLTGTSKREMFRVSLMDGLMLYHRSGYVIKAVPLSVPHLLPSTMTQQEGAWQTP